MGEGDEDPAALRESVDLDVGVLGPQPREVRREDLGSEPLVPVVRAGHPLARGGAGLAGFAAAPHDAVSRRGRAHGPVDDLLAAAGPTRRVVLTVPSHAVAAHAARADDLVALLPRSFTPIMGEGLVVLDLDLGLPPMRIEAAWHRRHDADGGHAWLRGRVREGLAGQQALPSAPRPGAP